MKEKVLFGIYVFHFTKNPTIGFFKPDLLDIMVTNPSMGCTIILRLLEDMTQSLNKDYRRLCDLGYHFVDEAIKDSELDPTLS